MRREGLVVSDRVRARAEHREERGDPDAKADGREPTAQRREVRRAQSDQDAARQPSKRDSRQRLGIVAGELLQRERAGDARRARQNAGAAKHVQPSNPRDDDGEGGTEGGGMRE
jgi:hypothetical protein